MTVKLFNVYKKYSTTATVGPNKTHVGYDSKNGNFQAREYKGTNFLVDALKLVSKQE